MMNGKIATHISPIINHAKAPSNSPPNQTAHQGIAVMMLPTNSSHGMTNFQATREGNTLSISAVFTIVMLPGWSLSPSSQTS